MNIDSEMFGEIRTLGTFFIQYFNRVESKTEEESNGAIGSCKKTKECGSDSIRVIYVTYSMGICVSSFTP